MQRKTVIILCHLCRPRFNGAAPNVTQCRPCYAGTLPPPKHLPSPLPPPSTRNDAPCRPWCRPQPPPVTPPAAALPPLQCSLVCKHSHRARQMSSPMVNYSQWEAAAPGAALAAAPLPPSGGKGHRFNHLGNTGGEVGGKLVHGAAHGTAACRIFSAASSLYRHAASHQCNRRIPPRDAAVSPRRAASPPHHRRVQIDLVAIYLNVGAPIRADSSAILCHYVARTPTVIAVQRSILQLANDAVQISNRRVTAASPPRQPDAANYFGPPICTQSSAFNIENLGTRLSLGLLNEKFKQVYTTLLCIIFQPVAVQSAFKWLKTVEGLKSENGAKLLTRRHHTLRRVTPGGFKSQYSSSNVGMQH
ncbi:hypothetical protein B0H16DRAFT_1450805 [Mycena metata]|uniref:Uncharacterized protein n=1 Tax=Mycena metata TaxID=1033252 RepID=A0AAD7JZY7_9AGAR|nr:hypothetical protein B0H16DRAFT_1450805 [Mycena metata]